MTSSSHRAAFISLIIVLLFLGVATLRTSPFTGMREEKPSLSSSSSSMKIDGIPNASAAASVDESPLASAASDSYPLTPLHPPLQTFNHTFLQPPHGLLPFRFPYPFPALPIPPQNCSPPRYRNADAIPLFTRKERSTRPEIAVITMSAILNENVSNLGFPRRATLRHFGFYNKLAYCQRHGYDYIMEGASAVDKTQPAEFSKLAVIRKWLPRYKAVMWIDDDALFMNFDWKVESDMLLNGSAGFTPVIVKRGRQQFRVPLWKNASDLTICTDWQGINSGVMLLRNSSWTLDFLDRWARLRNKREGWFAFFEQDALKYMLGRLEPKKIIIKPNEAQQVVDRSHVDVSNRCIWHTFPPATIAASKFLRSAELKKLNQNDRIYRPGHAVIHFLACRNDCLDWVRFYYYSALCYYGATGDQHKQQQHKQQPLQVYDAPLTKGGVAFLPFESYMPPT